MGLPRALIIEKLINDLAELRGLAEELEPFPELASEAAEFHRLSASAAMLVMSVAERAIGDVEAADQACAETWEALERARAAHERLVPLIARQREIRQLPRVGVPRPRGRGAQPSELYAAILRSSLRA